MKNKTLIRSWRSKLQVWTKEYERTVFTEAVMNSPRLKDDEKRRVIPFAKRFSPDEMAMFVENIPFMGEKVNWSTKKSHHKWLSN